MNNKQNVNMHLRSPSFHDIFPFDVDVFGCHFSMPKDNQQHQQKHKCLSLFIHLTSWTETKTLASHQQFGNSTKFLQQTTILVILLLLIVLLSIIRSLKTSSDSACISSSSLGFNDDAAAFPHMSFEEWIMNRKLVPSKRNSCPAT